MNSIYKKIIGLVTVLVLLVCSSCTKLDETPYEDLTANNLEFNDQDIEALSGSIYARLRFLYWGWNGLFDIQEESSDCIMTPLRIGIGWGELYIAMHQHTYHSNIDHFWTIWKYGFDGIGYANMCLDFEEVKADKEQYAKIRTMRALIYYILFDCFRNVPLLTTMDLPAGYLPEQADPQDVYDFIISELKEAKKDLGTEKVFGHPNKYVAHMVLAKMYLNHNAWFKDFSSNEYYELALAEADSVIQFGGYTLEANYKDCFLEDISTSSEIIFAIPLDYTYANHNYLAQKCLLNAGAKAYGYTGECWGGSCAIPQFIDTYDPNDKRFDDTWAHGQQYDYETGEALKADVDDQGNVALVYTKEVHSINNPGAYMLEGYRYVKNEILPGVYGTRGDDVPFFRLADAMFIKAECLLRLGRNQQEAADLITEVRQRAFDSIADATRTIADLTGGSVYDYGHREYTSEGPKNFSTFVATYEGGDDVELGGLLDDLAWEFVGEHHRRQDLIRFRLTSNNNMNVYNGKSWFCKDADFDMDKDIFPIHQSFLDANLNLVQNPGYEE
ncbi:MAG: RagB/SusD family nutrient uptake outer membrane protein [Bacteroidales bacterium]|nr:RagB/SusD family nutrient uptake outer membrane protein [Bacteroidales bacterium]